MRAIGIILAGGNNRKMKELSQKRAIGAMPIAGSYRSIDFALSNMSNSHIQKVGVLTQYNARSLNEHLSSSKWWDFGRKQRPVRFHPGGDCGEQLLVQGDGGCDLPEPVLSEKQP